MIGILIVNLNNKELTRNCLESLRKQSNKKFEIYLYDQNSDEDGTDEFLSECTAKLGVNKVIKNETNVPLNHLWSDFKNLCHHKYLCFLNNDVVVSKYFVEDNINILNKDRKAGIVIHVTNNPDFLKSEPVLKYALLEPPFYQGWDFTIRRDLMPEIPKGLKVFCGDDYIFAKVYATGYKIAMVFSSPIIHYKEKTRAMVPNIHEIQTSDTAFFRTLLSTENLRQINLIFDCGLSKRFPTEGMKLK